VECEGSAHCDVVHLSRILRMHLAEPPRMLQMFDTLSECAVWSQMKRHTSGSNAGFKGMTLQKAAWDSKGIHCMEVDDGSDIDDVSDQALTINPGRVPYCFIMTQDGMPKGYATQLSILKSMAPGGRLEDQGLHCDHKMGGMGGDWALYMGHCYDPDLQCIHTLFSFITVAQGDVQASTEVMMLLLNVLLRRACDPLIGGDESFTMAVNHMVHDGCTTFFQAARIVLPRHEQKLRDEGKLSDKAGCWLLGGGRLPQEAECKWHYWENIKRVIDAAQ
jgi:hypothetical protein